MHKKTLNGITWLLIGLAMGYITMLTYFDSLESSRMDILSSFFAIILLLLITRHCLRKCIENIAEGYEWKHVLGVPMIFFGISSVYVLANMTDAKYFTAGVVLDVLILASGLYLSRGLDKKLIGNKIKIIESKLTESRANKILFVAMLVIILALIIVPIQQGAAIYAAALNVAFNIVWIGLNLIR